MKYSARIFNVLLVIFTKILANLFLLGLIKRKLDNTIGRLLNDIIYQIEYLNALC